MKTMLMIPAGFALVLSLAACDRAGTPGEGNVAAESGSVTADADGVKKAFADFNAAIVAKDLDAIKAHYASDAVMVLPGQPLFQGADAIMRDYQNYVSDPAGKYAPGAETTTVSADGDMAYGEVNYQTTFTNPQTKAVETQDRYNLTLYKKQADGSWKIVRDINVPLPKAS